MSRCSGPKELGTEQGEGAQCLTAIPALQDLAAHGVLGCLGAAQILSIDPEAGVILLYQVTVVADHCGRGREMCVTKGCDPSPLCRALCSLNADDQPH